MTRLSLSFGTFLLAVVLVLAASTGLAEAADMVLYETSETIVPLPPPPPPDPPQLARTAPLLGSAKISSPLCLVVVGIGGTECIVTGVGSANVNALTGEVSAVTGTLAVVLEASMLGPGNTNPTDVAEVVVTGAAFQARGITPLPIPAGTPKGLKKKLQALGFNVLLGIQGGIGIDYGPAVCSGIPGGCPVLMPFSGTFRLPFSFHGGSSEGNDGPAEKPRRNGPAFYLSDTGKLIPVKQNERAIGYPTPRLEVTFP